MEQVGFSSDTKGAAAVEFALIATVYLICIFAIAELGRYVAVQQDLMWAVHTTGRYAIVHGSRSTLPATVAGLQTMIGAKLVLVNAVDVNTTVSFSPDNSAGSTVLITASYTWTPIVPLLKLSSASITATSSATIQN